MSENLQDIEAWLLSWFEKSRALDRAKAPDPESVNFFEAGWVDSLQVIELIGDVEKKFKIRFSADHFQDRRFSSIQGLGQMVREIQEGAKDGRQ